VNKPDDMVKIARNTKVQEIKDSFDHIYYAFKPIIEKHLDVEKMKPELLKVMDAYLDLPKRPLEEGMPVAGAIFYYVVKKMSSEHKRDLITIKEISIATRWSESTIRRLFKKLKEMEGANLFK
jgi:hypothetical protein